MSIRKKKSVSKITVLNVSRYQWVCQVSFNFSLFPWNFHVHTGWVVGLWPVFAKIFMKSVNWKITLPSPSQKIGIPSLQTYTFTKQRTKIGTNLTSKLCPIRREQATQHSAKRWGTHQRQTAGRGNSRREQKFGSKILNFHHRSKFLITSSYRRRQSDGIKRRETVSYVIPKLFYSRVAFSLKKIPQILITLLT